MSNLFFISSFGGTATKWLSVTLSSHPDIECFHEFQKITDSASDPYQIEVTPAEMFVQQAAAKSNSTGKYFGAVHRYHGLEAFRPVTAAGGVFLALTRDPVCRINSLFQFHLTDEKYKTPIASATRKQFPRLIDSLSAPLSEESLIFLWIAAKSLRFDLELASLPRHLVFKMEDLTVDSQYLQNLVSLITRGQAGFGKPELERIYNRGKVNQHAAAPLSVTEIIAGWTPLQLEIIRRILVNLKPSPYLLARVYEAYGYTESAAKLEHLLTNSD